MSASAALRVSIGLMVVHCSGRMRSSVAYWFISRAGHKEATLPDESRERDQAEARFKKAQKATQDANEARAHYESEAQAVREKTARLRALWLAKEAADLETRV